MPVLSCPIAPTPEEQGKMPVLSCPIGPTPEEQGKMPVLSCPIGPTPEERGKMPVLSCCIGPTLEERGKMPVMSCCIGPTLEERGKMPVLSCPNQRPGKVYDWSFDTQGWILSAFFYGYPVFQIPAGFFADRVGGKLIVGVGALVSAVCTLLIPLAADLGASYVIALRFLAGLAESTILPAVTAVWSKWAPPLERSTLLGIVFSGTFFGVAVSLPLSGTICYYLGWTYSFYIIGACGVAWCLLWFGMASDTPETHRTISDVEREYIITSLHGQHDIPWRFMMKSCAVWAIVMTYWSCCWTFFTFMTLLPTYMKEVLQFGVQKSGLSSALPFLASWFSQTVVGRFADYLTESQNFSVTAVRKGCIVIGTLYSDRYDVS
ncbi:sialin-like [Heptranchias perlo]|uniref:sialin-like n=1 Tax=Heptranchias perlo TaxID=212740 RepID=UPI00355AB602